MALAEPLAQLKYTDVVTQFHVSMTILHLISIEDARFVNVKKNTKNLKTLKNQ